MEFSIQYNNSTVIKVETFKIKQKSVISIQVAILFSEEYKNKSPLKMFFTIDNLDCSIKKHILQNQLFYLTEYNKFLDAIENIADFDFFEDSIDSSIDQEVNFVFKHSFYSIELYDLLFSYLNKERRDSTIQLLSEKYYICFEYFKQNVFVEDHLLSEYLGYDNFNNSFLYFIHKMNHKYKDHPLIIDSYLTKDKEIAYYFLNKCVHNDSIFMSLDFLITHYPKCDQNFFKFIFNPIFSTFIFDILLNRKPINIIQKFVTLYCVSCKIPLTKFIDIYNQVKLGQYISSNEKSDDLLLKHIVIFMSAINFYSEEKYQFTEEQNVYHIVAEMISHISEERLHTLPEDQKFMECFDKFPSFFPLIEKSLLTYKLKNF